MSLEAGRMYVRFLPESSDNSSALIIPVRAIGK